MRYQKANKFSEVKNQMNVHKRGAVQFVGVQWVSLVVWVLGCGHEIANSILQK